jgi:hypothetical protein
VGLKSEVRGRSSLGLSHYWVFPRVGGVVRRAAYALGVLITLITDEGPRRFFGLGTISRKTSDSTDKCNGQNLLDIAVTNALELLRGQNFEN